MNYQHWFGITDGRFGYGSMVNGFLHNVPRGIKLTPKASVAIHMGVPFAIKGFLEGQHKVNFTMWETDEMHPRFIPWLKQYDQILVPCHHNVELFGRYHDNVAFVPLGVDPKVWVSQKRTANPRFRIHAGGSLWKRKGLDLVVEACKRLKFDHELHIKLAPHAKDHPDLLGIPNVTFHRNWMTQDETVAWYAQADCWVAPARGEGFGLMPLQAISMGIPTIATATSGQGEWSHLANIVVPHRKVPSGGPGRWDESDPTDIAAAITQIYNSHASALEQAAKSAQLVREQFTWKQAGEKLAAAVPKGELLETEKFIPIDVKVRVRVNRNVTSQINDKTYRFEKGQDYHVGEGVFQVLWDAGYIAKEEL